MLIKKLDNEISLQVYFALVQVCVCVTNCPLITCLRADYCPLMQWSVSVYEADVKVYNLAAATKL